MLKVLLLILIISSCTLQYTHKVDSNSIPNTFKYKMYQSLVHNTVPNNNCIAKQIYVLNGSTINPLKDPDFDNTWFQGFYGIFLSLDKNSVSISKQYVKSLKSFLYDNKGILLRDFSVNTVNEYHRGNKSLEASKDQLLGLITSLFMIYYYNDNDPFLQLDIFEIVQILKTQMGDYFLLFNSKEGRFYNSAYYGVIHYYGLQSAVEYMSIERYKNTVVKNVFKTILFESLRRKIEIIETGKKTYFEAINDEVNIESLNIKKEIDQLEKEIGIHLKDIFKKDEFSVNLQFYEMLIVGTIDKSEAKEIIKLLENESVMKLKHMNLASLYIYLIKKWGIDYNKNVMDYYKIVISRDTYLYHNEIYPNSLKIGSDWPIDSVNGFLPNEFNLKFDSNWGKEIETDKTIDYLRNLNIPIHIDLGIPFLSRQVIINYK